MHNPTLRQLCGINGEKFVPQQIIHNILWQLARRGLDLPKGQTMSTKFYVLIAWRVNCCVKGHLHRIIMQIGTCKAVTNMLTRKQHVCKAFACAKGF